MYTLTVILKSLIRSDKIIITKFQIMAMTAERKSILTFSIIPLIVGLVIYICFRRFDILFFEWLGLKNTPPFLHNKFILDDLNRWIINYLPDVLWIFSFTSIMFFIWRRESLIKKLFWIITPLIVAFTYEFGQGFQIVRGTFDKFDFIAYVLGSSLSILLNIKFNKCLTIKTKIR